MYKDRILAFIDVLGFSNTVKKTVNNNPLKNNENYLVEDLIETQRIDKFFCDIKWDLIYKDLYLSEDSRIKSKIINQLSDSIIISYLSTEKGDEIERILHGSYSLCRAAIQNGFLLRGAIVCDKICHTEDKIFGPALVKAVEMEKNMAIYPRIIIDDAIHNINREEHLKYLIKDFDGLYFINYFSELNMGLNYETEKNDYLTNLTDIMKKMENIKEIAIKSKYLWLKEKYNKHIIKQAYGVYKHSN